MTRYAGSTQRTPKTPTTASASTDAARTAGCGTQRGGRPGRVTMLAAGRNPAIPGGIMQKFVTYRLRLIVVGDIRTAGARIVR